MVRLRLRRVGARNQPSYRIVAADKRAPRNGRFIEIVGHYNPRTEPATIQVDEARVYHWLDTGAQPSDAVESILKTSGTWARWERHKQGEEIDALLTEADEVAVEVDPRTRRDDLMPKGSSKKTPETETSATEEVEEDAAEAEAKVEETVEESEADAKVEEAVEESEAEEAGEEEAEVADESTDADAEEEAAEEVSSDSEEGDAENDEEKSS